MKKTTKLPAVLSIMLLLTLELYAPVIQANESTLKQKAQLGQQLFNDTSLSRPAGQNCAHCHSPQRAFSDPGGATSTAGITGAFGPRNSPSITYALFTPEFHFDEKSQQWRGGQFWDGRANTLQEQAKGPLFNPLEMNNMPQNLLNTLKKADYQQAITDIYGEAAWSSPKTLADVITDALEAFQKSEFTPRFTSKFDAWNAGKDVFNQQEKLGHSLFQKKAKCLNCHPASNLYGEILFTDYSYHNIGLPQNFNSPFLHQDKKHNPQGIQYIDEGLALNPNLPKSQKPAARGKFRTPPLRNVELTAPYMHNGIFSTLHEVVKFYNSRDTSNRWGEPEIPENINNKDMGDLKLSDKEIDALVAFLKTLNDGFLDSPQLNPHRVPNF